MAQKRKRNEEKKPYEEKKPVKILKPGERNIILKANAKNEKVPRPKNNTGNYFTPVVTKQEKNEQKDYSNSKIPKKKSIKTSELKENKPNDYEIPIRYINTNKPRTLARRRSNYIENNNDPNFSSDQKKQNYYNTHYNESQYESDLDSDSENYNVAYRGLLPEDLMGFLSGKGIRSKYKTKLDNNEEIKGAPVTLPGHLKGSTKKTPYISLSRSKKPAEVWSTFLQGKSKNSNSKKSETQRMNHGVVAKIDLKGLKKSFNQYNKKHGGSKEIIDLTRKDTINDPRWAPELKNKNLSGSLYENPLKNQEVIVNSTIPNEYIELYSARRINDFTKFNELKNKIPNTHSLNQFYFHPTMSAEKENPHRIHLEPIESEAEAQYKLNRMLSERNTKLKDFNVPTGYNANHLTNYISTDTDDSDSDYSNSDDSSFKYGGKVRNKNSKQPNQKKSRNSSLGIHLKPNKNIPVKRALSNREKREKDII